MSQSLCNYDIHKPELLVNSKTLNTQELLDVVTETNNYILQLTDLFTQMDFNLFEITGQRNLSGLLGEIFSTFFSMKFDDFVNNPHPDGRPDILDLSDDISKNYYTNECFQIIDGKTKPIKSKLSPFPYDGIEVKCTIGSQRNYKEILKSRIGSDTFNIGIPRIEYLSDLVWWAHHIHSKSLLGLYYDYYENVNFAPQIMAVFYSNLVSTDWSNVSLGNPNSKKTSNTSLTKNGKNKMKQNCLLSINDPLYYNQFKKIGILK